MINLKNIIVLFRELRINTFEKGEIMIHTGSTNKDLFFVRKGLVRSYIVDDKADEITFQLFPEQRTFGNISAILFNEGSRFTFQALEKTKVYKIDYESFQILTAKNIQLLELNRMFLGKQIVKQAFQRIESFVLLSPEDRYKKFVKEYPDLNNRVPDKYIANILGITPVSLSRIRSRIATKKQS